MVVQIDPAPGDGGGHRGGKRAPRGPLGHRHRGVVVTAAPADADADANAGAGAGRAVADEQEEGEGDGKVGDELGVAAGHAVALAVHAGGPLLLNQPLEDEVDGLAGQLAGEEKRYLDLARRQDEGGIRDAKALRDEG